MADEGKNTETPDPAPPDALHYPRPNNLDDSLRYLVEAREHVARQPAPPDYIQTMHAQGPLVGDGKTPAILNASYQMQRGSRSLASISFPDFTSAVNGHAPVNHPDGSWGLEKRDGFSPEALSESYRNLLVSQGLHPKRSKLGHDGLGGNYYIEYDLPPEEYEKAKRITEAYVHGKPGETPEELLTRVKASYADLPVQELPKETANKKVNGSEEAPLPSSPAAAETPHPSAEPIPSKPSTLSTTEHAGGAGAGMVLGSIGLYDSIKHHDGWESLVSGGNVVTSAAELSRTLAKSGQLTPALEKTLGGLGEANIYMTVADGAVQIYREDGLEHKIQRGAVVGTVVGTAGLGGVLGGGALSTMALPAVAGYAAEKSVDAARERDETEAKILDGVQVDHKTHANLQAEERMLQKQLDAAAITRDTANFDLRRHGSDLYDLSNDENLGKLSKVLKDHELREKKLIEDNTSHAPMVTGALRDEWGRKVEAERELRQTQAAEYELAELYIRKHPEAAAALKASSLPAMNIQFDAHAKDIQAPPAAKAQNQPQQAQSKSAS